MLPLSDLSETGLTFVVFEVKLFHLFNAVHISPELSELSPEKGQSSIELMHLLGPNLRLLHRFIPLYLLLLRDIPLKIGKQLRVLGL